MKVLLFNETFNLSRNGMEKNMITTVTLNPAITKLVFVKDFTFSKANNIYDLKINPGGNGLIISTILKKLELQTTAIGFAGGSTGKELFDILDELEIFHDFVWIGEKTRTNIKIFDEKTNSTTELLEPALFINHVDMEELKDKILSHMDDSDFFIFSDDVQEGIKTNVYYKLIKLIRNENPNKKVILDASGSLLENGIKAKPWLLKVNLKELSEYCDKELSSEDEIILESKKIIDLGIEYVCVTMDENGAILTSAYKSTIATYPLVKVLDTINPGEVFLAGLVGGFFRNEPESEILKYACALATHSVTKNDFTFFDNKKSISDMYNRITIKTKSSL